VIIGEGWSQQFVIVNVSYYDPEPTIGTLSFYTRDGQPWRLPIKDRGNVDRLDVNLKPRQMLVLETEVLDSPQVLGWLHFTLSRIRMNGVLYHAYTVHRKQTPQRPDLMTSVSFADGLEDDWIVPFDTNDGKYPGIAVVNSDTSRVAFTFMVYDADDRTGDGMKVFNRSVAGRSLLWFNLLQGHRELAGKRGQIKIIGGL
jgi:hypothetical protein